MTGRLPLVGLVLLASAAVGGTRHAVIIANNVGYAEEPELRFAESDAELISRTLLELGATAPATTHRVVGGSVAQLRASLSELLGRLGEDDELLLFVSGHAGASGLHYGSGLWTWDEVRAVLEGARARRSIAFVDACHSGALVTPKGLTLGPPLSVSLEATLSGRWVMTSSGANELSYESKRLAGSPFVHALVTGLRGAADADADHQVTVDELYAFVYGRTVAQSLEEGVVQRPARSTRLKGTGDWVLVRLGSDLVRLTATDPALGECYVLDADERKVIAQVGAGHEVLLARGRYRVKCLAGDRVRVATCELSGSGGDVRVDGLSFVEAPRGSVVARGPAAAIHHRFGARVGSNVLEATGPSVDLGLSYGFLREGLVLELSLASSLRGLASAAVSVASPLPWWRVGATELELGLHAGGSFGLAPGLHPALSFGQHTQLWLPLGAGWRAFVRLDVGTRFVLGAGGAPGATLEVSLGIAHQTTQ